jgi:hypothetical protein
MSLSGVKTAPSLGTQTMSPPLPPLHVMYCRPVQTATGNSRPFESSTGGSRGERVDLGSGIGSTGAAFDDRDRRGQVARPDLTPRPAVVVAGPIDEDPAEPRHETLGIAESRQLLPGGEERVLGHVLGHLWPGDHDRQPVEVGEVKIDQFVEGFTIALACSRDEIQRVLPRAR